MLKLHNMLLSKMLKLTLHIVHLNLILERFIPFLHHRRMLLSSKLHNMLLCSMLLCSELHTMLPFILLLRILMVCILGHKHNIFVLKKH